MKRKHTSARSRPVTWRAGAHAPRAHKARSARRASVCGRSPDSGRRTSVRVCKDAARRWGAAKATMAAAVASKTPPHSAARRLTFKTWPKGMRLRLLVADVTVRSISATRMVGRRRDATACGVRLSFHSSASGDSGGSLYRMTRLGTVGRELARNTARTEFRASSFWRHFSYVATVATSSPSHPSRHSSFRCNHA